MVLNVKTAVYWDVTSRILVDVYVHFVGTCYIFSPILKMNILKTYIASVISSVQTMKLVDGRKHSQGNTVCTFSSTHRMGSHICCVNFGGTFRHHLHFILMRHISQFRNPVWQYDHITLVLRTYSLQICAVPWECPHHSPISTCLCVFFFLA
jgi:hypothetical protein